MAPVRLDAPGPDAALGVHGRRRKNPNRPRQESGTGGRPPPLKAMAASGFPQNFRDLQRGDSHGRRAHRAVPKIDIESRRMASRLGPGARPVYVHFQDRSVLFERFPSRTWGQCMNLIQMTAGVAVAATRSARPARRLPGVADRIRARRPEQRGRRPAHRPGYCTGDRSGNCAGGRKMYLRQWMHRIFPHWVGSPDCASHGP